MAPRISSLCFGEACAGVWSRRANASDTSLVLETVFLFLVLWLALTTLAVVREMTWRRGGGGGGGGGGGSGVHAADKTAPLRRIVRHIGLLNDRCPARALSDTRAETCTVCLDKLDARAPARELPCAHRFHVGCIDRWVLQTLTCQRDDVDPSCPICKAPVLGALAKAARGTCADAQTAAAARAAALAGADEIDGVLIPL